jgi:hypothetical protein
MSEHHCHDDDCQACGLQPFERNRYFDGKLLVARDFADEQEYHRGKRRLHNSLLHGYGTVCGLKVVQHQNPACRHQFVVLRPGLALDGCGNEIVVPDEVVVDVRALIETRLREAGTFPPAAPVDLDLRLAYRACDREPVPVVLDDCEGCDEDGAEFNRTREGHRLLVHPSQPVDGAAEPLDVALAWDHTLDVAHPRGLVFDRDLMRLYLAEWDGESGWLRAYDANTHLLLQRLRIDGEPTAIARATGGDLIYVACRAGGGATASIAIVDRVQLEGDPTNALAARLSAGLGSAAIERLDVSPADNGLFALTADGDLLRWSADGVLDWAAGRVGEEPVPFRRGLAAALAADEAVAPSDMTITTDGRWLVVADGAAPRLLVVHLPDFRGSDLPLHAFGLPDGDVPVALTLSYQDDYLYALCVEPSEGAQQRLYRIELGASLTDFVPNLPAEAERFSVLPLADPAQTPPGSRAVDVAVSPRDNWVYVLRRLFDDDGAPLPRGEVAVVPVEPFDARRGPDAIPTAAAGALLRHGSHVADAARFQRLALIGQRLYVAGERVADGDGGAGGTGRDADGAPVAGSVSLLFVDEASCGAHFRRALDGCARGRHEPAGVVLMSLAGYVWNQPIVDAAEGAGGNVIDNHTRRPLAPSTETLRRVIECMLAKGISEGIPGPRGPVGATGPAGETGTAGPRGPGIQQVAAAAVHPGLPPTVTLTAIPGDPEGDQLLTLGIPRGAAITHAEVHQGTLAIALAPVDSAVPNGDRRMILTIPQASAPPAPTFNRVVDASWEHGVPMTPDDLVHFLRDPGLVVHFAEPVDPDTVNDLSVMLQLRWRSQPLLERFDFAAEFECECFVANLERELTDGDRVLRLHVPGDLLNAQAIQQSGITRLTVTLRGDWLLDRNGRGLDGNHILPGVSARPSGNATEGGDWISVIPIAERG